MARVFWNWDWSVAHNQQDIDDFVAELNTKPGITDEQRHGMIWIRQGKYTAFSEGYKNFDDDLDSAVRRAGYEGWYILPDDVSFMDAGKYLEELEAV